MANKNYYVYMIENEKGRHYIGIATDPERRVAEHNKGSAKSTRPFGPWRLIYVEGCANRSEALKREYYLKSYSGRKEKTLIIQNYHRASHPDSIK